MKTQRGALLNIQNKKVKSFSKIKKLGSFFNFHTKRPKLQNRGILGFGG
jgi:hypothetical protein